MVHCFLFFSMEMSCCPVATSVARQFLNLTISIEEVPHSIGSCSLELDQPDTRFLNFRVNVIGAE